MPTRLWLGALLIAAGPVGTQADEVRRDALGDPLPAGVVLRLGHTRWLAPEPPGRVDITPDGQTVVANCAQTMLWDRATGRPRRTLSARGVLTTDGRSMLVFRENAVLLWDVATDRERWRVRSSAEPWPWALASDGTLLAAYAQDGYYSLWEMPAGRLKHQLEVYNLRASCAAFTPDGKVLAVASHDGTLRFWDAATGKVRHTLKNADHVPMFAGFTPDGARLVVVSGTEKRGSITAPYYAQRWDPASGKLAGDVTLEKSECRLLALAPDTSQIAAWKNDELFVMDAVTGKVRHKLSGLGQANRYITAAFAADGKALVTGGEDQRIRLWDLERGAELTPAWGKHSDPAGAVLFSPDGSQIFSTHPATRTARLWDGATARALTSWEDDPGGRHWFSPDGRYVAAGGAIINRWDLSKTPPARQTYPAPDKTGRFGVAYAADGRLLATRVAWNRVQVIEPASEEPKVLWTMPGRLHQADVAPFRVPPRLLMIHAKDRDDNPLEDLLQGRRPWPDVEQCRLHDPRSGAELARLPGVAPPDNRRFALSPTEWTVAIFGWGDQARPDIRLWEAATGRERLRLLEADTPVTQVAFSADGRLLATADAEGRLAIWDVWAGRRHAAVGRPAYRVADLTFSPDGKRLAVAGVNEPVVVLDATSWTGPGRPEPTRLSGAERDALWA